MMGCAQLPRAVRSGPEPAPLRHFARNFDFFDGIDYEELACSRDRARWFGGIDLGFQLERGFR